ncbi:PII-interacting protein PipX family protein [Gloeobacter kilaueensis]|uniref:DUF3539 domain-containing protein n=1 Tax=Gloeobacter kilaueensis (strain ATCC BAA-2537 / CCAP 1431/1 / ULC 316 / JS1) TaxID=1183438 RepID=U5QK82_GLOK1|nr:PII-interacting protein PipX family protein [Gloeobacter kilaueensis]AGY59367.1 hypothetical protein GKIL_3121 [Gloeobacter kilaueensis JS1]
MNEQYLQHPNFGLLFLVCSLGPRKGLFATLYAQRMLFVVTEAEGNALQFESLSRGQARHLIDERLRAYRRGALELDHETIDRMKSFYQQV